MRLMSRGNPRALWNSASTAGGYAIVPNVNTIDDLRTIWPRLTLDEKKLFDVVARSYLAAVMPD